MYHYIYIFIQILFFPCKMLAFAKKKLKIITLPHHYFLLPLLQCNVDPMTIAHTDSTEIFTVTVKETLEHF